MKILIVLSVVQTGLLLFLLGQSLSSGSALEKTAVGGRETAADIDLGESPQSSSSGGPADRLSEARLRAIIQEEMAGLLAVLPKAVPEEPVAVAATSAIDETEYRYQLAAVTQKLDLYESVGAISDNEMHDLQSQIMALEEPDRTEAMTRLVQALNSGTLKGRF
jgi:hypothetical protein